MQWAESAIYTILRPERLAEAAGEPGPAQLKASKRWVTAKKLFDEARREERETIILYADAANDCSKLIYWGTVTSMSVDENGTAYTVRNLTPLNGRRTQELVLRSTGETIAEGYLRPYAVVSTPPFIPTRNENNESKGYRWFRHDSETTLFSFGYWGSGSATTALVNAVNEAEGLRGFSPPLWADCRISRSVRAAGFRDHAFERLLGAKYVWMCCRAKWLMFDRAGSVMGFTEPARGMHQKSGSFSRSRAS